MTQQELWDAEVAVDFRKRVHALKDRIMAARDAEAEAKESWRQRVRARKEAQAELEAAIEADGRPLPLFDHARANGPTVVEEGLGKLLEEESNADAASACRSTLPGRASGSRSTLPGRASGDTARRLDRVKLDALGLPDKLRRRLGQADLGTVGALVDRAARLGKPLADALAELPGIAPKVAHQAADAALAWLNANPPPDDGVARRCAGCGCTEFDCSRCIALTGKPCAWSPSDPELCTACQPTPPSPRRSTRPPPIARRSTREGRAAPAGRVDRHTGG